MAFALLCIVGFRWSFDDDKPKNDKETWLGNQWTYFATTLLQLC